MPDWASITALIMALVAIGGAITGWIKERTDHRRGVRADDREDLVTQQDRYEKYIDRVESRMTALEEDVSDLRDDLRVEARRYRLAVEHIREWHRWAIRYTADALEPIPSVPVDIADDI